MWYLDDPTDYSTINRQLETQSCQKYLSTSIGEAIEQDIVFTIWLLYKVVDNGWFKICFQFKIIENTHNTRIVWLKTHEWMGRLDIGTSGIKRLAENVA